MFASRGMLWSEFYRLLRRNAAPNSLIQLYRESRSKEPKIAIFDRSLPRRHPERTAQTGYTEDDHWRDSHICEAAWFNGEIPMQGSEGKFNKYTSEVIEAPYRGALAVLEILLNNGCLRRTDEIRDIFRSYGRSMPRSTTQDVASSHSYRSNLQTPQVTA